MGRPQADQLAAAVLALDPAALARFLDVMAGSPQVAAAGWRVSERRTGAERYPERNWRIRDLAQRLSYAQIGRLMGMSRYAVRNVVKRGGRSVNAEAAVTPETRLGFK